MGIKVNEIIPAYQKHCHIVQKEHYGQYNAYVNALNRLKHPTACQGQHHIGE